MKKIKKKLSEVLNTFENIKENGAFALCSIFHNIFKYIVFLRRYYGVKGQGLNLLQLAADVLSTLLEENDEDVDIWYLIGWANYRLGDEGKDAARSYLNKAKKLYKKTKCKDPDLLKHIDELLDALGSGNWT